MAMSSSVPLPLPTRQPSTTAEKLWAAAAAASWGVGAAPVLRCESASDSEMAVEPETAPGEGKVSWGEREAGG